MFPPVVIPTGGLGTRIRSLCPDLPKAMVPVNGEPFIAHQMRLLAREGVCDVVLCVGHLAKPLIDFVGNGEQFGLSIRYCEDGEQPLGTGGAIARASEMVASPFAVVYGDSYLDVPFAPIYQAFLTAGTSVLMTVYRNENRLIPSNLRVLANRVQEYNKEHPAPDMVHVDFGLSIFDRGVFAGLVGKRFDLSEVIVPLIAEKQLAAYEINQRFYEVGTPEGVHDLESHLEQQPK
ncbi:MAG TPA: sugar phosphate nucleotidyltransferase [Candidatus Obscuribacterales bacterium]